MKKFLFLLCQGVKELGGPFLQKMHLIARLISFEIIALLLFCLHMRQELKQCYAVSLFKLHMNLSSLEKYHSRVPLKKRPLQIVQFKFILQFSYFILLEYTSKIIRIMLKGILYFSCNCNTVKMILKKRSLSVS